MKENGFYLLKEAYIDMVTSLGGKYQDKKERPIYCCIEDRQVTGLYWAIPTSDVAHRTQQQMQKITAYCNLPENDMRSNYYHIATTNRRAIFKISNAMPITEKYVEREYISNGKHLIMVNEKQKKAIQNKLLRVLAYEGRFPNRLEQRITDIKKFLVNEITQERQKTNSTRSIRDKLAEAKIECDRLNVERKAKEIAVPHKDKKWER